MPGNELHELFAVQRLMNKIASGIRKNVLAEWFLRKEILKKKSSQPSASFCHCQKKSGDATWLFSPQFYPIPPRHPFQPSSFPCPWCVGLRIICILRGQLGSQYAGDLFFSHHPFCTWLTDLLIRQRHVMNHHPLRPWYSPSHNSLQGAVSHVLQLYGPFGAF